MVKMTQKKAIFLSESSGWSGGAAQLLALAGGLRGFGWEMIVACPPEGTLWKRACAAGMKVYPFLPFQDYDLPTAWRLARLIDAEKPAILHAHHPMSHAIGLLACYLARHKPVFLVSRRVSHPMRHNIFSRLKYKNRRISGYIAVAEAVRRILEDYGIPPEKITTIHSGVDDRIFYPRQPDAALLRELSLPDGVPVVGLIGNYSQDKGYPDFLKAAAILGRSRKVIFLCSGRDTDSPQLARAASDAGVPAENMRCLGFREDVPRVLSVLSVSVNASVAGEALSGSVRESLAMGIPVVASDIAGNSEIVQDGVSGLLFPPGNHDLLAELIGRQLDNPAAARAMGVKGLEFVRRNRTVSTMVQKTQNCYLRLLGAS